MEGVYEMPNKTAERKRFYTEPGKRFRNVYQEEIVDKRKALIKVGETNVYEQIQEELESTKIENILHAAAMGDLDALNKREATYIDATTLPKNLMESQNIILRAKAEFEKMPIEVRELFHNSAEEYVSEMGTKEFLEKMEPYNKKIKAIKDAGSKKEYDDKVAAQAKFENDVAAAKGANNE